MTIHLPKDVERSIEAAVQCGRFRSVDEAVATAWLALNKQQPTARLPQPEEAEATPDPLLGLWSDYADEMDEIVADAYRHRREETWREIDL